jgi:quinol monooxygenase YgiN
MSLLVRYTLKSAKDHAHQVDAMRALVAGLTFEGVAGLHYSCFKTDDPTQFIGVLEFPNDAPKQAFLDSPSFAAYRAAVGPTFANPPQTTEITAIASTRQG